MSECVCRLMSHIIYLQAPCSATKGLQPQSSEIHDFERTRIEVCHQKGATVRCYTQFPWETACGNHSQRSARSGAYFPSINHCEVLFIVAGGREPIGIRNDYFLPSIDHFDSHWRRAHRDLSDQRVIRV